MGREIIYRCDKCGVWINRSDVELNGESETTTFQIQNKVTHEDGCCAHREQVFMCQKCWGEFEKVYHEFMSKKVAK